MKKLSQLLSRFILGFRGNPHSYFLGLIFIFGLCLRLWGTNPGYPLTHQDEPKIFDSARNIALYLDFMPIGFPYGQLLPIIYAIGFVIFFIPGLFIIFSITNFSEILDRGLMGYLHYFRFGQLGYDSDPHQYFYYWSRYESAILSSLTILMVYFLGKRLFSKQVGLIAAFLTAVNYRHVLSSFFTRADAPAGLFALLSVFLSIRLLKSQSWKTYLLAGTGLALALSVKYFVYIIPAFLICYLCGILGSDRSIFKKLKAALFNKRLYAAILWGALLFFIINPHLILDFKRAYFELFIFNPQGYGLGSGIPLFSSAKTLVPLYYLWWHSPGPILAVSIILGILYGLIRYRFSSFILLSVIIPFLFIFLFISGSPYVRNFAAIIPFLLFFPAIFMYDVCKFLFPKRTLPIILAVIVVGWQSMQLSFVTGYYFSQPHNEPQTRDWIDRNWLDKVSVFNLGTVLPSNEKISEISYAFTGYDQFPSMQEIAKTPAQWISISTYWPVLATENLWIQSGMVGKTFFDKDLLLKLINNFYVSLATNEIAQYRIKEFIKPSYFSYDRNFFLAKIPDFWKSLKKIQVRSFDLNSTSEQKKWHMKSTDDNTVKLIKFLPFENSTQTIFLDGDNCNNNLQTIMYSIFPIEQEKLHTLTALGLRSQSADTKVNNTGFLRLDFLNNENDKPIKTFVSKLLSKSEKWQELVIIGFSPAGTKYARVGIQFDKCFPNEKYYFKEINLFRSDDIPFPSSKDYPYFQQKLPGNFIWGKNYE